MKRAPQAHGWRALHSARVERDGVVYTVTPGLTVRERQGREGPVTATLARASVVLTERALCYESPTSEPAGALTYELCIDGAEPSRHTCSVAEWNGGTWALALPVGAGVAPGRNAREELRMVAEECARSRALSTVTRCGFTGWRGDSYVHGGGAIGATGALEGVTAELGALAGYALPPPPNGDALREALDAALQCFGLGPSAVPVFALVWRSALGGCRLALHLSGDKGAGKTTLATLAVQHFGAALRADRGASWGTHSSALALLDLASTVGDAVLPIDDLKPSGDERADAALFRKADDVMRAVFNGSTDVKLSRNGRRRESRTPRAAILSTGEALPRGESLRDRVLCVHHAKDTDSRPLAAHGEHGAFALAMSAFLRWLSSAGSTWRKAVRDRERDALKHFASAGDRVGGSLAALYVGCEALAAFALEVRVMTAEQCAEMLAFARVAFVALAREQGALVAEENAATRFLSALATALSSGAAHVLWKRAPSRTPPQPEQWGWRPDGGGWRPSGSTLGYVDARELLIDPRAALNAARTVLRGEALPLSLEDIGRRLEAVGALARTEADRAGYVRVGKLKQHRLALRFDALGLAPPAELPPSSADEAEAS